MWPTHGGGAEKLALEGAQMVNWKNGSFKVAIVNMTLELIGVH